MHSTGWKGARELSMGNECAIGFFRFYIRRAHNKILVWFMQFPILQQGWHTLRMVQKNAFKYLQYIGQHIQHSRNRTTCLKVSFAFLEDKNNYLKIVMALENNLYSPESFSILLMKSPRKMDLFCLARSVYQFDLNQWSWWRFHAVMWMWDEEWTGAAARKHVYYWKQGLVKDQQLLQLEWTSGSCDYRSHNYGNCHLPAEGVPPKFSEAFSWTYSSPNLQELRSEVIYLIAADIFETSIKAIPMVIWLISLLLLLKPRCKK